MDDPRTSHDPARQRAAEDLFDAVRALPESERDAAIDAGSDDPWVRAEVRSLLRFDASTVPTLGGRGGGGFEADACIGLSIGGFTLRRVIGVGGMGTVFEADQELPARRIAVKVLHAATARASTLARFRKESEFLARLDHANIARVIAAGTLHLPSDGSARPYFAMELVDGGRTISRWAREEGASRRDIVCMLATACDAVGSGHRAGIVHLDLKPGNLLVSRTGALRVIDYGIARSLDAGEDGQDAPFAGTPQYMSPEQCTRGARVDSRADVYALGLILYELLSGRLPYETRGEPFSAVMRIVRENAPAPLRLVDSTIPRDLAAIVGKAIAKDADARYGTASELGDDLRRWLADETVIAAPPRATDAALRFVRRNPLVTGFAAVALAAIVAGAATSVWFALQSSRSAQHQRVAAARAHTLAAGSALAMGDPAEVERHLVGVPEELRGWEFRNLRARLANFDLLSSADSEVLSVASIDATGEVAGGVTGGTLVVADRARSRAPEKFDLRPLYADPAHASVIALAASADGATIFVNTGEATLFALERSTAQATRLSSFSVRARACGSALASAGPDGAVSLLDRATGAMLARCDGFGSIIDAHFSPDGRFCLLSSVDGVLRLVDIDPAAPSVRERWRTEPRKTRSRAAAVAPDGAFVVTAWNDGRISRHDPADGRTVAERDLRGGSVFDLAVSPDGRMLAASSWANDVRLIDAASLEITGRVGGTISHVWGIEFTADGSRLVGRITPARRFGTGEMVGADCLGVWRMGEEQASRDDDLDATLAAAAAGPEAWRFTACTVEGAVLEFDARDGSSRRIATAAPGALSVTRTASAIAVGEPGGFVRMLRVDGASVAEAWRQRALDNDITGIAASPDGAMLVIGDADHTVAALDPATGAPRWKAEIPLPANPPPRRGVYRPFFLDGGATVGFPTVLASISCPIYRLSDGQAVPGRFGTAGWEVDDAFIRGGEIYGFGVTGYITRGAVSAPDAIKQFALNGGVMCRSRDGERFFAATRDGSTRVGGFDPIDEVMRFESPSGKPLAISFDDEHDALTVLTARGLARTWLGSSEGDGSPIDPHAVPVPGPARVVRIAPSAGEDR